MKRRHWSCIECNFMFLSCTTSSNNYLKRNLIPGWQHMVSCWCCFVWNPAMWFLFTSTQEYIIFILGYKTHYRLFNKRLLSRESLKEHLRQDQNSTSLNLDHFSVQLFFRGNYHILFYVVIHKLLSQCSPCMKSYCYLKKRH